MLELGGLWPAAKVKSRVTSNGMRIQWAPKVYLYLHLWTQNSSVHLSDQETAKIAQRLDDHCLRCRKASAGTAVLQMVHGLPKKSSLPRIDVMPVGKQLGRQALLLETRIPSWQIGARATLPSVMGQIAGLLSGHMPNLGAGNTARKKPKVKLGCSMMPKEP